MNNELGFRNFIWSLRRSYLWFIVIALPAQFIFFKVQYPYPNFRGDSASYIAAAYLHADAAEWPVGYSKFLSFIHFFSHSDTFLVSIQYLLLEISALLFIFTLKYFIHPGKIAFNILFAFIVINPLFLHLGNYIMSDALFISLSLLWIAQLLWVIYRPSPIQIFLHALLLLCLFTVRYNAIFYPFVAALTFILSSLRPWVKLTGIALSLVLIGLYIGYTENKFYQAIKTNQFSPFSGWQLANNALYAYSHVSVDNTTEAAGQFFELDSLTRQSFKSDQREFLRHQYIKDYFIWNPGSPLAQYLAFKWRGDTSTDMFTKWASMGPIYAAYGSFLLRKYPLEYLRYFVWPNIINFFMPLIADLDYYNGGSNIIDYRAQIWFGYKSREITTASGNFALSVIKPYPFLIALLNIAFISCILFYQFFHKLFIPGQAFNHTIKMIASFWLFNFCFSASASSIELRYQIFQLILDFSFTMILLELLIKITNENNSTMDQFEKGSIS